MLEHVALNQTGFKVPGVAQDARGVLLGRQGAALLPALDRLVALLRLLSHEFSLDDLSAGLRIVEVRSQVGAAGYLLIVPAHSSYLMDRTARAAALCGGLLCTGSGKHFVQYRDQRSPLGYDVAELAATGEADFVLYTAAATQGYRRVRELSLKRLLFDLALQPVRGGLAADIQALAEEGERVFLTAPRGLGQTVLGYLWRSRVRCAAAVLAPGERLPAAEGPAPARPVFSASGGEALLLRAEAPPGRVLHLLGQVPGVRLYRAVLDHVIVELGHRHPLHLPACQALFDSERFYLFSAAGPRHHAPSAEVLLQRPGLLPAEALLHAEVARWVQARPDTAGQGAAPQAALQPLAPLQVPLRLCAARGRPARACATLVPWPRAPWLKRLVYALPPTVLSGYRCALIEEGVLVIAERDIDALPIGQLFHEVAPFVYAPLHQDLLPRVNPAVMAEHLGASGGQRVLLLPEPGADAAAVEGVPVRARSLPEDLFADLGRRVLAPLAIPPARRSPDVAAPAPPGEAVLSNEPIGTAAALSAARRARNPRAGALPVWGEADAGDGPGDDAA